MIEKKPDGYYYDIARANIRKYRKEKKYTQHRLAEEANVNSDYICEIESQKKNKSFSIAVLGRIADTLEVDIRNFFDE